MSEIKMVERVAHAIYDAATRHSSSAEVRKRWPWERATDLHDKYRAIARAAIEAMREPTGAMAGAGADQMTLGSSDDSAAAVWRAMVAVALISERGAEE